MALFPRRTATRRAALPLSIGALLAGTVTATVLGLGAGPVAAQPDPTRHPAATTAPAHQQIHVPNVVGMTESKAQCTLTNAGLRWRYRGDHQIHSTPVSDCSSIVMPDPKVISQRPQAGTLVQYHRVVVLDDECLARVRHGDGPCL